MGLEHFQSPIPRELSLLLFHLSNGSPFARVLFIWRDLALFQGNEKAFIKNKQWWWFSLTAPRDNDSSGANNKLINKQTNKQTKTQKGKLETDISIGGFEKLCYISVNLEGHIHA